MPTLHIFVPEPMRDWVQAQIDDGKYASADEYVRDLISRDQDGDDGFDRWRAMLDHEIALGQTEKDAGLVIDADAVFDELEARYAAPARQ